MIGLNQAVDHALPNTNAIADLRRFWNSCKNTQALAGTRVDEIPTITASAPASTNPFQLFTIINRDDVRTVD